MLALGGFCPCSDLLFCFGLFPQFDHLLVYSCNRLAVIVGIVSLFLPRFIAQVCVELLCAFNPLFVGSRILQPLPQSLPCASPCDPVFVEVYVQASKDVGYAEEEQPPQHYQEQWPLEQHIDEAFTRLVLAASRGRLALLAPLDALVDGSPVILGGDEGSIGRQGGEVFGRGRVLWRSESFFEFDKMVFFDKVVRVVWQQGEVEARRGIWLGAIRLFVYVSHEGEERRV